MFTRIKFCGLTRAEDVDAAVQLGADALGFVLVPDSRRALSLEAAAALRARVPASARAVLLFRDASAEFVQAAIAALRPDLLQFHGREGAAFCAAFALPYIFALPMGADEAADGAAPAATAPDGAALVQSALAQHPQAAGILLDAHAPGGLGGQGICFDWSRVPRRCARPLILAGGLHSGNVAEAVRRVRPYAVDVSSGIEQSPGVKDYAKMQSFIEEVRRGERN